MKFGVIRFPGSCDDVDAQLAASRVGEAVLLWHADRDLQGVDAVIVPGGFSYGDYLRAGAIARFAPVMEDVIAFARDGGPVLGICNGFQVLCEAGLLPGALLPNAHLRFRFRQVTVEVLNAETAFTRACAPGERLSIPCKHMTGRYWAPDDELDRLQASGQIVLRYAHGREPQRLGARRRRRVQRGRQRDGPHAPSRARRRRAVRRQRRRAEALRVGRGGACLRRRRSCPRSRTPSPSGSRATSTR